MLQKLRILAVTNTYPTATAPGDSPQIEDLVEALEAKGITVDVLYVDIYRGLRSYIRAAWRIARLSLQPKQYDLIHAFYGYCGFLARLQARYPIVVTFLGSDLLHPRDGAIGKIVARVVNGVIVQSEEMRRVAGRDDAVIIPFGINLELFKPCSIEDARLELGLPLDKKLVLFPWNPARGVKRFDLIQEAVRIASNKIDSVQLIAVYGQRHETVAKYMNACDALVLASVHEGAPMAIREAMACNLPIVAVDVGDVRQLIENIEGCYLCQRDPADIAEKLSLVFESGNRTNSAEIIRQAGSIWAANQVIRVYGQVLGYRGDF